MMFKAPTRDRWVVETLHEPPVVFSAQTLSVLPWNRVEPVSLDLLRRAFLTRPVVGRILDPITETGCPGGVCVLEARAT